MRQHRVQYVTIHGHRRAFVKVGSGPAVLLLHGLGCDHRTWLPVIDALSRHYTVIAPDLLGHGASDKPRADYSVGGFANGMRDLLTVLGVEKATVVGHSFGAAWRCSSPTSSPSAPSVSCWSARADSAPRSPPPSGRSR